MDRLVAAMIALFAGLTLLPRYLSVEDANLQATIDADAATQFQTILQGATKYVTANETTLASSVPVGGSTTQVPFSSLSGYLPSGFGQTNVLGQTWEVYVRQPVSGQLQVLVEGQGGRTLAAKDLVKIAGLTGDLGGFVPYNGMLGNLSSSTAQGTNWTLSLDGLPTPGAGRLLGNAVVGADSAATVQTNDFLYRVGVSGHTELNTMDVALNMGGNNITNAATVNAVQGVFSGNVTAANATIKGTTTTNYLSAANGTVSGNLTVGGQVTAGSAYVSGQATVGSNVTVASGGCAFNAPGTCLYGDGSNSAVRTKGAVYFQNFAGAAADTSANHASMQAAYTGTDNGQAVSGAACSPNGAFASSTDGTGTHLECVSGVWKALGGGSSGMIGFVTFVDWANDSTQIAFESPNIVNGECPSGSQTIQMTPDTAYSVVNDNNGSTQYYQSYYTYGCFAN